MTEKKPGTPALPLFTDAFLTKTVDLTCEEIGAYMMILMASWQRSACDYPDDDDRLAILCRLPKARWIKVRDTLERFFVIEDGVWKQARLQETRGYVEKNRANGAKGGRPKASHSEPKQEPKEEPKSEPKQKPKSEPRQKPNETTQTQTQDSLSSTYVEDSSNFPTGDAEQAGATDPPAGVGGTTELERAYEAWDRLAVEFDLPRGQRRAERDTQIAARLKSHGLAGWYRALDAIRGSPFLRGEKTDFRASLPWLAKKTNFENTLEDTYGASRRTVAKQANGYQSAAERTRDAATAVLARRLGEGCGGEPPDGLEVAGGGPVIDGTAERIDREPWELDEPADGGSRCSETTGEAADRDADDLWPERDGRGD